MISWWFLKVGFFANGSLRRGGGGNLLRAIHGGGLGGGLGGGGDHAPGGTVHVTYSLPLAFKGRLVSTLEPEP